MSVALYCPIKPPDHPIPSGDRAIARDLLTALRLAALRPFLASRHIAYSKRPERWSEREREALAEADRVIETLGDDPPALWLTYHPYCKAPDWIGPRVARALSIPYVTLEAARTAQPGFERGRQAAREAFRAADLHLVLKPTDRAMLLDGGIPPERLAPIAPFIDIAALDAARGRFDPPSHWRTDEPVVLVAAMMRPGKKERNFRIAARAVAANLAQPFRVVVAGDGPAADEVRSFFCAVDASRIRFTGLLERPALLAAMEHADVFLWPGHREPIGMTFLEAASRRTPAVAFADMGVPLVVEDGRTGLLAPVDDEAALAERLALLLAQPRLREDLAAGARERLEERHGLAAAARALRAALAPLVNQGVR